MMRPTQLADWIGFPVRYADMDDSDDEDESAVTCVLACVVLVVAILIHVCLVYHINV